jgi:hypothetical protein
MILVVTYDLKSSTATQETFFGVLKNAGPWWHYLSKTWLVKSDRSPKELYDLLKPHITEADRVLIVEYGARSWGTLPKAAWDWIKTNHQTG